MSDHPDRPEFAPTADLVALSQLRIDALRKRLDARRLPDLFCAWEALGFGAARSRDTVENYRHACCTAGALLEAPASVPLVELWLVQLRTRGIAGPNEAPRPLASTSVRSILAACVAVASRAGRALGDASLSEVLRAVDKPSRRSTRPHLAPPPDALERILAGLDDPAERLVCILAAATGARRGELMALHRHDFHAGTGRLTIQRQRDGRTRKNVEPVTVQLRPEVARLVVEHLARPVPLKRHGPKVRDPDRLFPWGLGTFNALMARIRAHLGDEARHYFPPGDAWHQFRRFAAQSIEDAGGSSRDVARVIGDTEARARGYYSARPAVSAPVQLRMPGTTKRDVGLTPPVGRGRVVDEAGHVDAWVRLTPHAHEVVPTVGAAPSVWDVAGDVDADVSPDVAPSVWDVAGDVDDVPPPVTLPASSTAPDVRATSCDFDPFAL